MDQERTGNEEEQTPKRSSSHVRPTTKTAQNTSKLGKKMIENTVAATRTNLPPIKQKKDALVLKHWRVRLFDVQQQEAIAKQRQSDSGDIVRKSVEQGTLVNAALGAPGTDGHWGLLTGSRLAELLKQDVDGLIGFLLAQGVVPTMLQEYRNIIHSMQITNVTMAPAVLPPQPMSASPDKQTPVTEVSDEADELTSMFFGES